ncbi:hypothetical protein [Roseovarius aestuariivivens]|uniref:hypothetical protein n=1 Tax=Roseovarius aestuariivivens TaxID=1888910 RepID=UPI001081F8E9|nr:hypothetical protein [Roseovarius aestuariivivens]
MSTLTFALNTFGKPLLRGLIATGDPRDYSREQAFFIDLLGGNVALARAQQDIAKLQEQVHEIYADLEGLDAKVEWYHRNDPLSKDISAISDRFKELSEFMDDGIARGLSDAQIEANLRDTFTRVELAGFDLILKFMHRVILDLHENNTPKSQQTIFDAYENFLATRSENPLDVANPREYFWRRYELYDYYASLQRKAATLAALHYRAQGLDAEADGLHSLVESNLSEQYQRFLDPMPPFVKAAVVSFGKMRIELDELAILPDAEDAANSSLPARHTLVAMVPGIAITSEKEAPLSPFNGAKWVLTEDGEDAFGLVFKLTLEFTNAGQQLVWAVILLPPAKTYKGLLANNQVTFENLPHLAIGHQISGKRLPGIGGPSTSFFVKALLDNVRRLPNSSDPIRMTLGVVTPTSRENHSRRVAGRSTDFSYDDALRFRIANTSPHGLPGTRITQRSTSRTRGTVFAAIGFEDGFPSRSGKGDTVQDVIRLPANASAHPPAPHGAYIERWGASLDQPARSRGIWRNGMEVRYKILTENLVSRATEFADVAPSKGARAGDYFRVPQNSALPLIVIPSSDPRVDQYRLFRQIRGEADFTEVTDMDFLPEGSDDFKDLLVDMGGWINA